MAEETICKICIYWEYAVTNKYYDTDINEGLCCNEEFKDEIRLSSFTQIFTSENHICKHFEGKDNE